MRASRGDERRSRPWVPAPAYARRVVARVRSIPRGYVATYGDIDPSAPRQVGQVLATSEDEMPWHRVVRADGTAPIGDRQLGRLRREGVPIRGRRVVMRLARYGRLPRSAGAGDTARRGP